MIGENLVSPPPSGTVIGQSQAPPPSSGRGRAEEGTAFRRLPDNSWVTI